MPDTVLAIRRVEQSLQLVPGEIADERLIGLLHRDRMDPTRLVEARRHPVFQEAEERVDRGEPGIACSCRVAALLLQMLQECQDERRVEPLDLDLGRLDLEPTGGEAEQELEALRIGLAGMLACPALLGQMLAQEAAEIGSERGHAAPPMQQCLAGLGDLAHQDRRRLQVPVGVGHVRVAEIGAERHDMAGDRSAIVPALLERANREGVAQIVDARVPSRCAPLRPIRSRSCRKILRTVL